jgi:hypothetical protein
MGVDVTLTEERWAHILSGHPEMVPHRADLGQTIEAPNVVYEKRKDRYYFRRVRSERFGSVYLHARAIPNPNHFVVTAWLMPRLQVPKGAVRIWTSRPR